MVSTIEYLALGAVAVVLLVSVVQAMQLSGLNEKVGQQNALFAGLVSGAASAGGTLGNAGAQNQAPPQTVSPPSQQMVGGC